MDAVSWGADGSVLDPSVSDVPSGHSIERRSAGVDSDRAADFVDNQRPSPGASYEAAGANPKQRNGSGSVDILAGSGERDWSWLPWALVAVSGAACAATAGWRGVWFARDRLRRP